MKGPELGMPAAAVSTSGSGWDKKKNRINKSKFIGFINPTGINISDLSDCPISMKIESLCMLIRLNIFPAISSVVYEQ